MGEMQDLILGSIHEFYSHNTHYYNTVSEEQDVDNRNAGYAPFPNIPTTTVSPQSIAKEAYPKAGWEE